MNLVEKLDLLPVTAVVTPDEEGGSCNLVGALSDPCAHDAEMEEVYHDVAHYGTDNNNGDEHVNSNNLGVARTAENTAGDELTGLNRLQESNEEEYRCAALNNCKVGGVEHYEVTSEYYHQYTEQAGNCCTKWPIHQ